MHQGGSINKNTVRVIRLVSLILPVVLFVYALLIRYDILAAERAIDSAALYGVMLPWVAVATFQFFSRSTSRASSVTYLLLHHMFGVLYILFISGFAAPVVVSWIILLVAAHGFYSRAGTYASATILTIAAAADGLIHHDNPLVISTNAVAVTATLAIGAIIIKLGYAQTIDSLELEKSKAQEMLQRDRMLTIVNNLADAVLSTDHDGIVQIYNAASLNLLDTNDSLVGKHINDILALKGIDDEPVDFFASLAETHSVIVRDDLTLAQEGEDEPLRLEVTYSPIRSSYSQSKKSESEDGYILILRDVTKAKSLEEERDEFISVVSHELRTPITIAEGTISNVMLMMEREDAMKDKLPAAIQTAHEQVVFLAKMVNDLSTLSRAERGVSDDKERIDVKQLSTDLFHEYSSQAQKRELRLDLDLDTHLGSVMESPLYLKELLQGFITNAIKYTKEGTVTLRVSRSGDNVTFAVKDTGIGMSKTDQAKIFKKFYRSEDYRTRETGGTGLGLYVATKLARKLNTKIVLESRLNYGSTFSFTLPIHKPKNTTK